MSENVNLTGLAMFAAATALMAAAAYYFGDKQNAQPASGDDGSNSSSSSSNSSEWANFEQPSVMPHTAEPKPEPEPVAQAVQADAPVSQPEMPPPDGEAVTTAHGQPEESSATGEEADAGSAPTETQRDAAKDVRAKSAVHAKAQAKQKAALDDMAFGLGVTAVSAASGAAGIPAAIAVPAAIVTNKVRTEKKIVAKILEDPKHTLGHLAEGTVENFKNAAFAVTKTVGTIAGTFDSANSLRKATADEQLSEADLVSSAKEMGDKKVNEAIRDHESVKEEGRQAMHDANMDTVFKDPEEFRHTVIPVGIAVSKATLDSKQRLYKEIDEAVERIAPKEPEKPALHVEETPEEHSARREQEMHERNADGFLS